MNDFLAVAASILLIILCIICTIAILVMVANRTMFVNSSRVVEPVGDKVPSISYAPEPIPVVPDNIISKPRQKKPVAKKEDVKPVKVITPVVKPKRNYIRKSK